MNMNYKAILAAVLSFGLLAVGCTKEDPTSLENISVDKTYVSFKVEGSTETVVIKATEDWKFKKNIKVGTTKDENGKTVNVMAELPTWLTASTLSGAAGETTLTLTAGETLNGREAELAIEVGTNTQIIMVRQGNMEVSEATCAEVAAGPDGKNYRVTGVVTSIVNTQYGNWYLDDGTGSVYIYGTLDAKGAEKNFLSLGIEAGDIVTAEGPKTTYGSTIELVNVTVVKIVKSLLKNCTAEIAVPCEGGDALAKFVAKGETFTFDIPAEYQDWLSVTGTSVIPGTAKKGDPDTTAVALHILPNDVTAPRSGAINFTAKKGKSTSESTVTINQDGQPLQGGTLEKPFTIAEAIEAAQALASGTETSQEYYIKGKFARWNKDADAFGANSYGNASFWLSDDGESTQDKTKEFEGYRIKWFGDVAWVQGNANLCKGDVIVLKVTLKNYNGTSENGKVGSLISVNGLTTDAEGLGNVDYPLTVTGAIAYCQTLESGSETEDYYYVAGKFARWNKDNGADELAQYGNGTFWLSQDGQAYNDKTKEFEGYRINWYGNKKWVAGNAVPAAGDDMVLHCTLKNYNGTSENGKGYLYSLNGATE